MTALNFSPALSALAALAKFSPPGIHTMLRATGYKLRPPAPRPHPVLVAGGQARVLAQGTAVTDQRAALLCERRLGAQPTIVLGGFVPDSTEQVFLLRGFLLRQGSVYYFNYPRGGFSTALLCAQLDDLVTELNLHHGQRPVIFGVSFGAGIALEWLRRSRAAGRSPEIAGVVLVSPVACAADIVTPGETKPSTLLGRALKPYLDTPGPASEAVVEKSRAIFAKMFEAGAQNRAALRALMTATELRLLREAVLGSIRKIDVRGAHERVQAMAIMPPLSAGLNFGQAPLCVAPVLVLYAEKETAVLAANSPTHAAFESALAEIFPAGETRVVSARDGNPVQHASLIFHYFQFLPPITEFYRRLKSGKTLMAA